MKAVIQKIRRNCFLTGLTFRALRSFCTLPSGSEAAPREMLEKVLGDGERISDSEMRRLGIKIGMLAEMTGLAKRKKVQGDPPPAGLPENLPIRRK